MNVLVLRCGFGDFGELQQLSPSEATWDNGVTTAVERQLDVRINEAVTVGFDDLNVLKDLMN